MKYSKIHIAVDAIVFGYDPATGISVLLVKRKYKPHKGQWALPGGFVEEPESLEKAVERELKEETGIKINYLEQLYTFGKPGRDPRKRVVSVAYYGLVRPDTFEVHASTDAADARWFNFSKLPKLAFDHKKIVSMAIERLRGKITYEPIGFELLDENFPFSDLHQLYATLLDRDIDRRNFKKKILSLGVLEELREKHKRPTGRPGNLYRFDVKKYFDLKKEGINFEI